MNMQMQKDIFKMLFHDLVRRISFNKKKGYRMEKITNDTYDDDLNN
jgi:hypothetical protein